MDVHCHNVVDIDDFSTSGFCVAQQSLKLEKTGSSHKFQDVIGRHLQIVATAAVQILHDQLRVIFNRYLFIIQVFEDVIRFKWFVGLGLFWYR
jgi:hypothetical protein